MPRGLSYLGQRGTVFDDRYHLEVLTTPTQTRHALCSVLQNARRHGVVIARLAVVRRLEESFGLIGIDEVPPAGRTK